MKIDSWLFLSTILFISTNMLATQYQTPFMQQMIVQGIFVIAEQAMPVTGIGIPPVRLTDFTVVKGMALGALGGAAVDLVEIMWDALFVAYNQYTYIPPENQSFLKRVIDHPLFMPTAGSVIGGLMAYFHIGSGPFI